MRWSFQLPRLLECFYPFALWRKPRNRKGLKTLYLTFDDGCVPQTTPALLELLDRYQVKATFFVVGENALRYPDLVRQVALRGHRLGNHTFHHLNGFSTPDSVYLDSVEQTDQILRATLGVLADSIGTASNGEQSTYACLCPLLFRPPYGKMRWSQLRAIRKTHEVVLWDLLTHDYNPAYSPARILCAIRRYSRDGSVVVFHDSIKAQPNLLSVLERAILFWQAEGYTFGTL